MNVKTFVIGHIEHLTKTIGKNEHYYGVSVLCEHFVRYSYISESVDTTVPAKDEFSKYLVHPWNKPQDQWFPNCGMHHQFVISLSLRCIARRGIDSGIFLISLNLVADPSSAIQSSLQQG